MIFMPRQLPLLILFLMTPSASAQNDYATRAEIIADGESSDLQKATALIQLITDVKKNGKNPNLIRANGISLTALSRKHLNACIEKSEVTIRAAKNVKALSSAADSYRNCAAQLGIRTEDIEERKAAAAARMTEIRKSCSTITIDETAMGPVRDQGRGIPNCFAHAGADVLSFEVGQPISALDLMIRYNDSWLNRWLRRNLNKSEFAISPGSFIDLPPVFREGLCAENKMPGYVGEAEITIESYRLLERLKDSIAKEEDPAQLGIACEEAKNLANDIFPALPIKEFMEVLLRSDRGTLFPNLTKLACKDRIPGPKARVRSFTFLMDGLGESLVKQADSALNRRKPVAIGYNARIIEKNIRYEGHAGSLVGRRFDEESGDCQYRIRDVRGSNVGDGGYFWKSQEELTRYLTTVDFFE